MSEWEIISEQRAPQTMPPPMSPPAVDNEWEVVSEREAPNAMPPPTASGGWEIIREEPASQSAWAPSLDTVNIPEYGDIDPYAYADLKPADIVGEQAPRKGDSVPVALGKAAASAIPAWGKSVGGMVRATEEASLGTPLTLSSDIAATITSPLKALKGKEYEGVDEFGQPMKMSLDWLSAVPEAYRNFAGWIRKKLPDIMNAPIIGSVEKAMGLDKSIGQTTGEYWSGIERQWQPEVEKGSLLADVTGAVASVAQVAPGIVASIITKNPNIALNTFFATTLGQTYEDIREKKPDLAPSQALAGGIISGAAEKYTEKLPLEALLNPKWGFWKRLFANMGLEVPGEEIATIVQSGIVEKATTNPDMNVKEFLQMLRDTAVQTLIASPMQVAISHPLIKYVERQEKKIAEQEQQQASQPSPAAITPENLRWLVENRETLGLSDDDVAPYLKIIENATPRPTEELSGVREKMKAGEATPEEVIDAYSSKLDDIAGLMQEKEATTLEARRGRYGTPGQTALDFGTEGTPLFDATQPSPTTEKTQPAATSEGEGATKEPWQMVPAEYVGDAARDEKAVKLAAHPMHVKRALEEGKTVPLEVLDKYRNNYWAQKAIERLHGEAALKEPEAGYGEAGLDNVSKTKDNAAMSKDKGTGAIPAKDNPTPGTGAKYNQRAIRKYGLATADESIGFITRDGRGIDSSGRRQGSSSQGRNIDHRQIAQDALGDDGIADGWTKNMRLFMNRTGNIRVVGAKGEVNIDIPIKVGMPTNKQLSVIKRLAAEKKIYYDFTDESGNSVFSGEGPYGKFIKDLAGTIQNESEINSAKSAGEIPRQLKPMADFIRENNLTKEQFQDIRYNDKNPLHETMNKLMDRASLGINKVWDDFGFNHQGEFYDRVAQTIPNPSRPPEVGGQSVKAPIGQYGELVVVLRSAWTQDTEKSVQHSTVNSMKAQPGYKAAKAGDFVEGVKVAQAVLKPQAIAKLKAALPPDAKVIVVPVQSLEAQGENAIPAAMARVIADMTGWEWSGDIFQVNRVEHTDKNALERLLNQAVYDGPVEPGTFYLIVDDVVTQGGTLANLKGMIEAKGGKVIGIHTIGAAMFSTNLKVSPATVEKLKKTYGQNLETVLSYVYGGKTNAEHITESEARTFLNKKDELLDAARTGRLEADIQGRAPEDNGISGRTETGAKGKVNELEKEYRDNAELASQAVAEIQRPQAVSSLGMRDRGRTAGGEPVRVPGEKAGGAEGVSRRIITLAKTVSDLKELKSIRLRGTEAATWNAVYDALRIVRNANVEILNVLYRGKTSGTILYNEAYSCRLPGSVENVSASLLAMNAVGEANKLSRIHKEEVEIILSHNHPSGDVTVSDADRKFTKEAAAAVALSKGNFAGHIVINHNKYSLVDAQGKAKPFNLPDVPEEYRNDPLLTMPVPHKVLGKSATMPDHIALVARDINRGDHYFTVLLRAGTKIRGIVNVPLDILNDKKAATEFIHELAVQHGAQDVFAYREDFTNEQKGTLINMVKENTFRDVVYDAGNVAGYFPADRRKIFGKDRTTIEAQRLEGVPQEVKGKGAVRQVDAWHGSPHTFDKFKSEKIGIGEGNQSFGWGLYFTDLEDVARHYAEKLGYGADIAINGKPIRKGENAFLAALSTDLAQATMLSSNTKAKQVAQIYIDSAIDRLENNLPYTGTKAEQAAALEYLKSMGRVESIEKKHSRNLYKVTLHKGKQLGEYNWLEWDKEVPDSIYKKMEDSISPIQEMKGRSHQLIDLLKWTISRKGPYSNKGSELYKELAKEYGSDKEASLFLLRAGIDGIKYPAGSLSGMKTDASNYVVFDENAVTVEQHSVFEKEGEYGEDIEKEIAGIIETAKKNGTHLKAPNGKDTKLNPRQWAMVRTIRFKNWFGDWEKLEQKRLLSGEPIKVLTGKEFSKDENKDLLEQVSEWFKSKEVGGHAVSPFLGDVILDKEGIRATIAHGPLHRRKAIAFAAVPEIIRKGILLDYSENWKGRGYDTALLAAPVRMGSDDTVVFVVVKQAEKQKFHLEEVYTKKMLEEAYQKTGTRATSEVVGEPGTAPSFVLKIALPVFSVKGKDVSKVVDENGEPLVVYHATNKDFSEFSKDAIKSRFPYSFGFHFTDRIPEANQYTKGYGEGYLKGGNIMPVYLNAQRPLLINTSETSASMEADLNRAEIISKLYEAKKVGHPYDSVVIKRGRGDEFDGSNYIVFETTQIKSATGNIGTFDKTDTNILKEEEAPYGEEEEDDSFDFGANIEKAIEENPEKHISLDFKDHLEGYIGHLFNMVVAGEPGKRLTLEGMGGQDQVVSWGSTYPEFMKGQGWSAKEVLAALRHAQAGEKTTDKQKEIIRAALHQATDMFFEDMDRWAPNLSEEALEKMEASIEPAIDDFLSKYYREKREREIERQKIARTTKITKSQYDWEREKQKAKEGAWMKGFKSRQEEVNALQSELAKTEAKLQTQIAHVRKLFEGEKIKEGAWKEAERIKNTEIKTLQGEIKRLKDRLAKAKEEAAPKPKVKRMSRKGQIRIVTGQVLANEEINLREMDALKSQIRMEAAAAREAYRAGNKAGLAKARARYQSMKDILRIKRAQQADIRKMIKQMKDVAKKADQLPPEYKLAITDLLEPWDMARLTDKNRVKLQAIRNEMETNKDADFPPSMLETLKRLDKRPIRDLSYDEIQSIHRAVMHFATLGRNKIKGMAAQQRIVREMTRGVVKGEMKEAEAGSDNYDIRYSDEKKIKGFLQKAKNQFGIHLIGWEALVESVSGPRSMFYKAIYRNIKEGTIERDKAMYELEDLFLKAQDAFQQKHGIKDIADWLDADRTIEYVSGKTITMSRNQLISLELGWRDADWRRSVEEGGFGLWNNPMPNDPNRVYQLGPEGIEKIIAAVTPTEREYADMAVPIIQKTGDMLADKFLEINGYEMPRTESGAYWRKDVMASERGKTDEQTELEKARLGRPGIFKGMTIQRTGDSSAVWLKPFTVAMREMSKRGADYVALEEPMSLAAWLMYDKEFRKEFDKRYGMPLWKEIEQGLKDLSDTYQPVRDTTWERVGTWLRNKSTLFALGLNYATMLKQFTGAINYLVYVDPVHLANAIVKYGTNRNDVRRLHKQMSTEYRHRREEGYSQDVGNVITSLSATGQKPSLVTRIGVAGMRPLQAIDIFGVDIGMLAAVDQALDAFKAGKLTEDMKDALDMSDEDIKGMTYAEQFEAAYKWADYCTERTQNMSRPEHMSGWQRGSEFSKQFSMFMGEVQKNLTGLYRAYNKVQRGDIGAHMHLTKNILLYLVVSSLIIDAGVNAMRDILRGRRPDRWWAVGLKAITSPIPIIRDITQTAVDTAQGKGFGLSGGDTPIARFQESIAKVVVKGTKATTGKTAKERKEAATATADAILNTAALAAGLPWPAVQEPFRIAKREETARKERQRNR